MNKFVALTGLIAAASLNGQSPDRAEYKQRLRVEESLTTIRPSYVFANDSRISWGANSLLTFEKNDTVAPVIHVFSVDGRDTPIVLKIPKSQTVHIFNIGQSASGYIGVAGIAADSDGHKAGFISGISPDHNSVEITRMAGLYIPQLIAMAPDGSTWVKGWEPTDSSRRQLNTSALIVRHFDATGRLVSGFLSSAGLPIPRFRLTDPYGFLIASSTRAGWHPGFAGLPYYEFINGTVVKYPALPITKNEEFIVGLAMTQNEEVFAGTVYSHGTDRPHGYYLYKLDRKERLWHAVDLAAGSEAVSFKQLIGAQNRTLVFGTEDQGVNRLLTLH